MGFSSIGMVPGGAGMEVNLDFDTKDLAVKRGGPQNREVVERAQAMDALSGLTARASQMTGEQREQASAMLGLVKDRLSTLPEDARSQVSSLLSRFTN